MNKKIFVFTLLLCMLSFDLFCETILVAPVVVYDKDSKRIETKENPAVFFFDVFSKRWFEGLINFSTISKSKYGEILNVLDANKACTAEKADFILYGYIQKNEVNWFGNIKLYNLSSKKVVGEYYCADGLEHYDRLLESLSNNILEGISEVTGLNHDDILEEKRRPYELRLPFSAFYWTPIDPKWNERILGIAGAELGLEFYPQQKVIIRKSKLLDVSARFDVFWNCGINQQNYYPLFLNNISICTPFINHVRFDENHSVYFGAGPGYAIQLMNIQPKYEKQQFYYQNVFFIECLTGYELHINRIVNLFSEVDFDFHLTGGDLVTIKPKLGISFTLYGGEK